MQNLSENLTFIQNRKQNFFVMEHNYFLENVRRPGNSANSKEQVLYHTPSIVKNSASLYPDTGIFKISITQ